MDVVPTLQKYIKETFLVPAGMAEIGADDPLLESGIIDSMGILQFVGFIESEFGIEVDDEEIVPENFETIAQVAKFVEVQRGGTTS